jgi:hypothetical protein
MPVTMLSEHSHRPRQQRSCEPDAPVRWMGEDLNREEASRGTGPRCTCQYLHDCHDPVAGHGNGGDRPPELAVLSTAGRSTANERSLILPRRLGFTEFMRFEEFGAEQSMNVADLRR